MHPTHGKALRLKESLQWAGWFWSQWKWSRNVLTNYCSPKTSALQMMAIAEQPPLPLPSSLKAGIQFFHFRICTVFSQSGFGDKLMAQTVPEKHTCVTHVVFASVCSCFSFSDRIPTDWHHKKLLHPLFQTDTCLHVAIVGSNKEWDKKSLAFEILAKYATNKQNKQKQWLKATISIIIITF